ncbi:Chromate resistance protein ChrB [Nocardiopsis sediminis]|uniref:Chromate resistance protein ChrB n=1 Tax=Nocardiopsis sediminis TaxID=1778267 RepID=A0ABV8FMV5_9ACTN
MTDHRGEWVLLAYRMPREPSSPRIAVWRKLKRLGIAQIGDGLAGLPADARTREHFDWIAEEVEEHGGTATVWLARPASAAQEHRLAAEMAGARAAEYRAVIAQAAEGAHLAPGARSRLVRRLREELRRINRRDHFPPPQRDQARRAVQDLAGDAAPQATTPATAQAEETTP